MSGQCVMRFLRTALIDITHTTPIDETCFNFYRHWKKTMSYWRAASFIKSGGLRIDLNMKWVLAIDIATMPKTEQVFQKNS